MRYDFSVAHRRFILALKFFRVFRGLGQEDLARAIKVSTRHIQRLESGDAVPCLKTLFNIAEALNIDIRKLASTEIPSLPNGLDFMSQDEFAGKIPEGFESFANLRRKIEELNEGDNFSLNDILELEEFKNNKYPLYFSSVSSTCVNNTLLKETKRRSNKVSGTNGYDLEHFFKVWDYIIYHTKKFYKGTLVKKTPAGKMQITSINETFTFKGNETFVLGIVLEGKVLKEESYTENLAYA